MVELNRMVNDMNDKKIPVKNYIIALLIVIITVALTILIANTYNNKKEYEESQNIRMGFLDKIDKNSIGNYIVENHDVIIYISDSSNIELEEYETQLKRMIIAMEYEKEIVYLDAKDLDDEFYNNFKQNYFNDDLKSIDLKIPNLLIVENGKVSKILYTYDEELRASDLIKFINNNVVME